MSLTERTTTKAKAEYDLVLAAHRSEKDHTQTDLEAQKEKVRNIPVCLITPPSPFLADERVFPFLAPPKLAAELQMNGNEVAILDLSGYANYQEIVEDYVNNSQTKVFGITATTPQIPNAIAISRTIKSIDPNALVILGGPHITLTHGAMVKDLEKETASGRGTNDFNQLTPHFDKLVAGDGEKAIFYAIDPDHTNTLIDAGSLQSPLFMQKGELESFASPRRDLIDMDSYSYYIDGHRAFSLIAQLGCPFECGFCGGRDVQAYRMARTRNINSVLSEIEEVVGSSFARALESGDPSKALTAVMFYDDELNVSPSNLENLCHGLIDLQRNLAKYIPDDLKKQLGLKTEIINDEERIAMRFRGFVKAELFTKEQAELMYEAGFRILLTGVESGSDKILAAMRKHTSRVINSRCVTLAHAAGLKVKALMSLGHPGESKETIAESIEWALSNLRDGDEIDWTVITQYPGSPYYDHSVFVPEKNAWLYQIQNKKTLEVLNLWSKSTNYEVDVAYYKGIPGSYTAYVWTDHLTPEELVYQRDLAETTTRNHLNLPPVQSVAAKQFEHSMGQSLPKQILHPNR